MNGAELREIRTTLGATQSAFARALGYGGNARTLNRLMRRLENDHREIPPGVQERARLYATKGLPHQSDKPLDTVT